MRQGRQHEPARSSFNSIFRALREFFCTLFPTVRNYTSVGKVGGTAAERMNRDELETLVRTHQAEIYRYVRYLGAFDRALAEDLVQDAFLAAFGSPNPPPLDELRRQSAWLRGIARNLFLAHCRRERNSPVTADSTSLERAEGIWATEFLRDGDGFDYVEALRTCLGTLAEKQRQFLDLRYHQHKSRLEMAQLLKMSQDGIKTALHRIRTSLLDCIQRRLHSARN
jgi:RNA polymerase sigma-70 factor, ECF subfamily